MIGRKITERREQIGLTQTDLARIMNVSPSRISDLERGAKTDCNVSTAKRLARGLGCGGCFFVLIWIGRAVPEKCYAVFGREPL